LELLSRKISGKISIGTFQNYVIDEWINNMSQPINHEKYNVHLFERNVDDTVYTFCNFAYRKKQLSELEFQTLFNRAQETQMKYKIPSYSSLRNFSRVKSTNIWSDVMSIAKIIERDIYEDEIDQRIIGLDVDNETALKRVVERARQAEQQYTLDYLTEFNEFYKKLFDYLESDKTINSIHELCFKL
jgi:hypothetical protein